MAFQIPNSGEVPSTPAYANGAMADRFSSDDAIIEAAMEGYAVYSGCQLTAGTTPGTVKISSGTAAWAGGATASLNLTNVLSTQGDVAAQDNIPCIANADASNPLWILYELDKTGTLQANVGTAATGGAVPVPPTPTAGRIVVGAVFVPSTAVNTSGAVDTALSSANGNAKILDKRAMAVSSDYRVFTPVYTTLGQTGATLADGVTNTTATTLASASNGVNLNTLVGAQTLTLASTAGLAASNGVLVLTHSGTDFDLTYLTVSGSTITGVTAVGAPNQVISTGDVVTRAKTLTSATAGFSSAHAGSFVTGSADLPQGVVISTAGSVPGGGTWARLNAAVTGSHTAQAFVFAAISYTYSIPTFARYIRVILVGGGGGGGSGSRVANITTAAHGGGGGGPGGITDFIIPATNLNSGAAGINVGMGGPGGFVVNSNANGTAGTTGGNTNFGTVWANGGGSGAGGVTGGAVGGSIGRAGTVGTQISYTDGTVHLGPCVGGKGANGTTPAVAIQGGSTGIGPGGGGGGGGNSAVSALQAAGSGGGGSDVGFGFLLTAPGGVVANANAGTAGGNAVDVGTGAFTVMALNTNLYGGGGAGGNGHNVANGTGGAGGKGAKPGGGGGGGGSGVSTGTSGAGGTGGDGMVIVMVQA